MHGGAGGQVSPPRYCWLEEQDGKPHDNPANILLEEFFNLKNLHELLLVEGFREVKPGLV